MDTSNICKAKMVSINQDVVKSWDSELQELVQSLPVEDNWTGTHLYSYQGFWCPSTVLKSVISIQKHFKALNSDIIIVSFPKCGTTWLKALTFATLYRNRFARDENHHPLRTSNPHQLIPFLEYDVYLNNPSPDLENNPDYDEPRLFNTHIPYASLPTSIKESGSKIVYICRNPMDMFISLWLFCNKLRESIELLPLDEAFDKFCHGIYPFGPFFDHVLGYWKASQENPNKILFLQYEDLKEDINSQVRSLAVFLGIPFTEEEEKQGVVEEIAKFCSFEELKEQEGNKKGLHKVGIPNKDFFRKGKVGDWSNYLTPSMAERMEKLIHEKLDNTGLTFKLSSSKTASVDASA